MPEERSESRSFRIIPLICALLAIALGLLTLIGWISGVPLLESVRANYIPMAPSTAFCFTLIGVGLIAHLLKAALRWIPRVVASVVLAVACAKSVEIFGDLNFGIDRAEAARNLARAELLALNAHLETKAQERLDRAAGIYERTLKNSTEWARTSNWKEIARWCAECASFRARR